MSAKINGKESSLPLTPITKKTGQLAETISFHKLPTTSGSPLPLFSELP